jgi:alkylation response protein AidB-like acyl-CoA dehydrogenase
VIEDIIADVRTRKAADGSPLGADPLVRQQVADL